MYVPFLKFSVISLSALDDLHYSTLFVDGIVSVFDTNN